MKNITAHKAPTKFTNTGWFAVGLAAAVLIAAMTYLNMILPVLVIASCLFVLYCIYTYNYPVIGLYMLTIYCFIFGFFAREFVTVPFGTGIEVFELLAWVFVLLQYKRFNWGVLNNALFILYLLWFIISVLEVINPAGASVQGWLQEIRSTALNPILIIPISFLLLNSVKEVDKFIAIVLTMALLATLNGLKQKYIGLFPGEQVFLNGSPTHLLWGRLRVFSFFSDAGQFGASQAAFTLTAFILALGPFKNWKKAILFALAGLFFYGMLISGTRGALFALVTGGIFAIILSKNFKILLVGGVIFALLIVFLKFTSIGNGVYDIQRMRTALDPQEASLNVRMVNQHILRNHLANLPFGGGLGVIGHWGKEYNADKFLSTIEPDSYWVKVWAMYGIVGFIVWFCIIMYLIGQGCGIIWKLKDASLRIKVISLFAGAIGLFFCSYGNEVMNSMPSSLMFCISMVIVFLSPHLDRRNIDKNVQKDETL